MKNFTHLHTHSHYSLLSALPKVDELVKTAKSSGMTALALTDNGNMYGAIEFYKTCKSEGIKPIIGVDAYLSARSRFDKQSGVDKDRYHLTLLAKNAIGYKNLMKLTTLAHLEGFYYKPRIDEELLAQHSQGLIAMSACLQGKIPRLVIANKIKEAEELALKYQKIFGKDNFYFNIHALELASPLTLTANFEDDVLRITDKIIRRFLTAHGLKIKNFFA